MKTVLTALALVAGLAACNTRGGEDTARVGESADTMVTPRTTQDTTIVSSDTTVTSDTTVKEGEVKRDTAKH
jgi:predicted small secreted protein